ncbi:MAG TPA: DNA topoisomerase I [Methanocorpusculum sp.]|nr:DNA topoisomerase I [Methanocorpusculum sp.]HJK72707.1 DNA topoisomerase I [Methanocorpusculum sp.]HJK84010.1 DNA topoisomerase I [Methanocorpusculum sp.]
MHLIIAEKNLVAERIAAFLAGKQKVHTKRDGAATEYTFGDTVVMGLRGHVVELDFTKGYSNWRSEEHPPRSLINAGIEKHPTEKKIVALMQKHAKKADRITIATDYDTEGELIGMEAYELVRAVNQKATVDRARFSAITKDEITKAIADAKEIDFNLAAAGETRQVIDLVWGASLTRFLSIAAHRGSDNILSVGRVQSPTLAMIVDREKEIEAFVPEKYWMLSLTAKVAGEEIAARHVHGRFTVKAEADAAFAGTRDPVIVREVITGKKNDKAPTPLDTTALIVGAGRLGLSAASAMSKAEDLYMRGFISYPRTDNTAYPKSLNIRQHLKMFAGGEFERDANYVLTHMRAAPTRGKKETTDHPPIYPTSKGTREEIGDEATWKLYEFIVRRFFATLSPDAEWKTLKVNLTADKEPYTITGGRLLVPGWRAVYPYSKAEETVLPEFSVGERLELVDKNCEEKETQPPARYSQSRLIQRMEELGLGTKSTRHEVISKLIGRKYIEGNPMKPTVVGRAVTESLEKFADTITEPTMTKTLEESMEDIAAGKKTMNAVLTESRTMLSSIFDDLEANKEAIGQDIMDRTREEQTVGQCPICGAPLRIRRVGTSQFIGCSSYPDCTFNTSLPPATWGNAVKMDEVCPIHHLNHVQLLRKGAPAWKIGCPLCSHIKTNAEAFRMLPGMTDAGIEKLNSVHIYAISELASISVNDLMTRLKISRPEAEKMIADAEDVLVLLRKRTELKKFISLHVAPRRGRGHSKVSTALISKGIVDITTLADANKSDVMAAGLSEAEADTLLAAAAHVTNVAKMKQYGVPTITLKKYVAAGYDDPKTFVAAHPAGLSLATGASVTTVCRHQKLVAEQIGAEPPKPLSKAAFDEGIASLTPLEIEPEHLTALAFAGVYSCALLKGAAIQTLSRQTGIDKEQLTEYKNKAKKVCGK